MAYRPSTGDFTSQVGYAQVGYFWVGGVPQDLPIKFACKGKSSFAPQGNVKASGQYTASGVGKLKITEGYVPGMLPRRRPMMGEKPCAGYTLNVSHPLAKDLMIHCIVNEGGGADLLNPAGPPGTYEGFTGSNVQTAGQVVARSIGPGGEAVYAQQTSVPGGTAASAWVFGSDSRVVPTGNISVMVMTGGIPIGDTSAARFLCGGNQTNSNANFDWEITWEQYSIVDPWELVFSLRTTGGLQIIKYVPSSSSDPTMIGFTYDGSNHVIYINGVAVKTTAINQALAFTGIGVELGNRMVTPVNVGNVWSFYIYGFWMWGRGLNASEVMDFYYDPYCLAYEEKNYFVETPAHLIFQGKFECDGRGKLAVVGTHFLGGIFKCSGVGTFAGIGVEKYSGSFSCSGVGKVSWFGSGEFSGVLRCSGVGTATWRASTVASGVFECDGVGTFSAKGSQWWSGSGTCSGVGTAYFLVGIDSQQTPCLTPRASGPGVPRLGPYTF